ncbi:hypothetical protein SDC9_150805 [bioreactor metagenome]|uniref:Uncharacterized protein n=1 Tax=bioreactor metagenome TaxID=1076179 RepID=A0A645ESU4_9ZZZZ
MQISGLLALSAQGDVAVLIPLQSIQHVGGFEVRPIVVNDVKIGVDRLCRQKPAQSPSPAPTDDQVNAADVMRGELLVLLQVSEVPFPVVVYKEIDVHKALPEVYAVLGVGLQGLREGWRVCVADDEEICVPTA